jgi:Translation initiation factor 2B subunit, eIF-2B alpha/beta/delta family
MIDETIAAIAEMRSHSSSAVAIDAAESLRTLCDRDVDSVDQFRESLRQNAGALRRANPSHASLFTTMERLSGAVDPETTDIDAAKQQLSVAIDEATASIETGATAAARAAAPHFETPMTLLTHDYSTTVLQTLELAGAAHTVYITEARPRYLGRKMARQVAARPALDAHLLVDAAAASVLDAVDAVLIGMTCVVGPQLYNRIGTQALVRTAVAHDVPVYAVGAAAKVVDGGFRFENEFRPPRRCPSSRSMPSPSRIPRTMRHPRSCSHRSSPADRTRGQPRMSLMRLRSQPPSPSRR